MRKRRIVAIFIFSLFSIALHAQDITNFTQFFINPYSINPSYAGIEGRGALFLSYRKQWMDIEGAPTIGSLTFHSPTNIGLNYGLNITNDTRGILSTTSAMVTMGYTLTIDKHKFIRFGLSGGASSNTVDTEAFDDLDASDPVLNTLLDKNMYLIGNAGLSFHLKSVHFGASLPNIFTPAYVSTESFSIKEVKPFQSIIIHASNRFYFAKDKNVFEPYLVYRMVDGLPSQLEAAATVHLNHTVWFGGSYKQDFGISVLGGIKMQNFLLIGGSYSLKNSGDNELNSPTIEIQLGYIFGAKRKDVPVYSFVNTVKEKEKKKTPSQLAAEKKKAEEEKKKQQEAIAKQQQEAQVQKQQQEAIAKQQQEAQVQKQQQEAIAKQQQEAQVQKQQQELAKKNQEEAARQQEMARREQAVKEEQARQANEVLKKEEAIRLAKQQEEAKKQEALAVQQQEQAKKTTESVKKEEPVVVTKQTQQQVQQQNQTVTRRHDGGPRLKSDVLSIEIPTYDTAHHEEQARISRLEEHAADPDELHNEGEDAHPHAERHEFVKKGAHKEELDLGNYVVAGVFKTPANAKHFAEGLTKLGFGSDYGHLTEKNLWYVYISQTDDINVAKADRDKFRKMKIFRDSWLLTVHQ